MPTILLALLAASCFAQSQPPVPSPVKPTQDDKSKAASKQNVAADNKSKPNPPAAAVDKLSSDKTAGKQQQSVQQNQEDAASKWWAIVPAVASATAALVMAILGILQYLVLDKQRLAMNNQSEYMRQQAEHMRTGLAESKIALEENKKAAEAAMVSAKAATKSAEVAERALYVTQRADVLLVSASINGPKTTDCLNPHSFVALEFKNLGTTRAEDVMFRMKLEISTVPDTEQVFGPIVIGPGNSQEVVFSKFGAFLSKQIGDDICSGKATLGFGGSVTYRDVFGQSHTTAPKGMFDIKTRKFLMGKHSADQAEHASF